VIARFVRLLLASGFLAAVAHVAPVAERAALGISHGDFVRVEDLAPEAIARPLGEIRAACRVGRLARRVEGQGESGDACGLRESSPDVRAQPPGTIPNHALTPGAVRTADPAVRLDDFEAGPMSAIVLHRIEPEKNMARFYRLDVQPDLFGWWSFIREWGRIGRPGQVRAISYPFHGRGLRCATAPAAG
jgi:WGR domain